MVFSPRAAHEDRADRGALTTRQMTGLTHTAGARALPRRWPSMTPRVNHAVDRFPCCTGWFLYNCGDQVGPGLRRCSLISTVVPTCFKARWSMTRAPTVRCLPQPDTGYRVRGCPDRCP